jgi:ubiquitin-like 1-activating enzyme E1 B
MVLHLIKSVVIKDMLTYHFLFLLILQMILLIVGGIGTELLKNAALSGFQHVHTIDLDTIDVSNLNRQLLFRSQHVGMPKCKVACEVAAQMVPDPSKVQYIPSYGNVCDNSKFNVQFVAQFDLVLNALDNVVARRRVNRLCLAAGVPLVEAGTTGYLGQVNVIDKASNIACYECKTQETQKVYPICTIRSTPSMPVHTIVWAKEFYKLLFGTKVEESMLFEDPAGEEPSTYMQTVTDFRTLFANEPATSASAIDTSTHTSLLLHAAKIIVTKLYVDEIQKQLDMDRYKTAMKTPVPLSLETIEAGTGASMIKEGKGTPSKRAAYKTTDVWSQQDCIAEFAACLVEANPATVLPAFDKDDHLAMRFITATSNLRSYVFSIDPIQSFYAAKGIAGNIIPAIATTNAIAAGLQILQAFNILRAQLETKTKSGNLADYCHYVNCIRSRTRNGLYLTATALEEPNPKCFVCRNATIPLTLNVNNWTLQDLLAKIIKKDLGFDEPTIMLEGDIIWEEGEDSDQAAFETNLAKMLPLLPCGGIQHGTVLSIEDFSQDMTVNVAITHQDVWELAEGEEEVDPHKFVVGGTKPQAVAAAAPKSAEVPNGDQKPAAVEAATATTASTSGVDDDDDDVILVVDDPGEIGNDNKRAAAENGDAPPAKKLKASIGNGSNGSNGHDVIEIE